MAATGERATSSSRAKKSAGSQNLPKFLEQNRDALRSDVAVVSDTGMVAPGVPTLSYGLRGVTALEVKVTGPKMDLHSGIFGGAVQNPITALARLLATLHDSNGHIAIDGLYDKVKPLEDWEREAWRELPIDIEKEVHRETGVQEIRRRRYPSTTRPDLGPGATAKVAEGIGPGYRGRGQRR